MEVGERVPIRGRAEPIRGDYAAPMSAKGGNPFAEEAVELAKPLEVIKEQKGIKVVRTTRRKKKIVVRNDSPMEEYLDYQNLGEQQERRGAKLRKFGNWAGKFLVR